MDKSNYDEQKKATLPTFSQRNARILLEAAAHTCCTNILTFKAAQILAR